MAVSTWRGPVFPLGPWTSLGHGNEPRPHYFDDQRIGVSVCAVPADGCHLSLPSQLLLLLSSLWDWNTAVVVAATGEESRVRRYGPNVPVLVSH